MKHAALASAMAWLALAGGMACAAQPDSPGCADGVDDSLVAALQCASLDQETQHARLSGAHQALQARLSREEADGLAAAQAQWQSYQASHCALVVAIAGRDNPAWRISWAEVADLTCRAELAQARALQLEDLLAIAQRLDARQASREPATAPATNAGPGR